MLCIGVCISFCLVLLAACIVLHDSQQKLKKDIEEIKTKTDSSVDKVIDVKEVLSTLVDYMDKNEKNKKN